MCDIELVSLSAAIRPARSGSGRGGLTGLQSWGLLCGRGKATEGGPGSRRTEADNEPRQELNSREIVMPRPQKHPLIGGRLGRLAALSLGCLALLALVAVSAFGEVVQSGNLIIGVQGSIHPSRLPKDTLAPISLEIGSTIKTANNSRVPVLSTISLEFNRHGGSTPKGSPPVASRSCRTP